MTLHTRMAILAPVPLDELHRFVNTECLGIDHDSAELVHEANTPIFDREHFEATRTGEKDERGIEIAEWRWLPDGTWDMGNRIGQGFPAWFWMTYRPDGPLRAAQTYYADGDGDHEVTDAALVTHEYCEPGCTDAHEANPPMAVELNFDTAYGYTSPQGFGCSVLHALYIVRIGRWLAARRVSWRWYNEFTGEWHDGFDGLAAFVGDGQRAASWYHEQVEPLIKAAL